jgi:hypothetical protein
MILALMIVVEGWGLDIALHSILSQNESYDIEIEIRNVNRKWIYIWIDD